MFTQIYSQENANDRDLFSTLAGLRVHSFTKRETILYVFLMKLEKVYWI